LVWPTEKEKAMNTLYRLVALPLAGLGLLVACGGDGTGPTTSITVSGLVRDLAGEPVSGAGVLVLGKSQVTTGTDGRFSIPGVATPYAIAVISSGLNAALVYNGVTRSDPALLYLDIAGVVQSATISGTAPLTSGTETLVFFSSGRHGAGSSFADPTTGQYTMTVTWEGSTTQAGQLSVLRFTRDLAGLPSSYDGYASKALTISAGGAFPGNDFAEAELTDPPEQTISGTVTVPAGYTQSYRRLYHFFGRVPVTSDESGTLPDAFSYTVPAVAGVVFGVAAWADGPAGRLSFFFKGGISGNSTNISVPLPAAAQLASPADGATGVDATTPFSWIQGEGTGVNFFELYPDNFGDPTVFALTTGATAKLPNLAAAAMGLPASAGYHWLVDRIFPLASINDAAGEGLLSLIDLEGGDTGEGLSESFGFTVKAGAGPAPTRAAARSSTPGRTLLVGSRRRASLGGTPLGADISLSTRAPGGH
jgi:hypothetical protein